MQLDKALEIAERTKELLAPYCERIEIAGSIRRKKPEVKDIELVAIPKPYNVGLFESGIATVVNQWQKVRGELPCKYTQRLLPDGIALDLFFTNHENWGLTYATRTGSADYSHKVLGTGWVKHGYESKGGQLYINGEQINIPEEKDLFELIGVPYLDPELRNY